MDKAKAKAYDILAQKIADMEIAGIIYGNPDLNTLIATLAEIDSCNETLVECLKGEKRKDG